MGPWEIVGTLANGGTLVLYDGAPDFPGPDRLWAFVERHRVNVLGVSPTLIRALMAHGDEPVRAHDLSSLRVLASTGEPWNEAPVALVLRRRRRRPLPGHQHLRRHRGRRVLPVAARRGSRCRRARSAAPRSGMAVDVFDDDGQSGARRGRRARVHEAVAGHDARVVPRSASATSRRTGRAGPDVWWHGDFASVCDRRPMVPARPLRRHDQARGQAARPGRGRDGRGRASGGGGGRRGRCSRRAEGRGAVGVRGARARASSPTTRCAPSSSACVVDALGPSFKPAEVRFTTALPKTRSAKVLRRAIRSVVTGDAPGDLSGPRRSGDARRDRGERVT